MALLWSICLTGLICASEIRISYPRGSDSSSLSVRPLVLSAVSFPNGYDHVNTLLGPAFGLLEHRDAPQHTLTTFIRHVLIDPILANRTQDSEVAVLSDVPSLMHFHHKHLHGNDSLSDRVQFVRQLQNRLISSVALLDRLQIDVSLLPQTWQKLDVAKSCDRLLALEGTMMLSVVDFLANSSDSSSVILILLNQGVACYAEENDLSGVVRALELLNELSPESLMIRMVVPVQEYAKWEVMESVSREVAGLNPRRRLQQVIHDSEYINEDTEWLEAPNRQLKAATEYTYRDVERRLIFVWTTVGLGVAVLISVLATLNMPLHKEPLLYTRIYAGH